MYFRALDLPVTDHTYEDCRLMDEARAKGLPYTAGIVEFQKLLTKLGWVQSGRMMKKWTNRDYQPISCDRHYIFILGWKFSLLCRSTSVKRSKFRGSLLLSKSQHIVKSSMKQYKELGQILSPIVKAGNNGRPWGHAAMCDNRFSDICMVIHGDSCFNLKTNSSFTWPCAVPPERTMEQ